MFEKPVLVDPAREVGVAGFEGPAEAAGFQVAQSRVIASEVQSIAAPRFAQLHLEASELHPGLNPRDAEIRIDQVLAGDALRAADDALRGAGDDDTALLCRGDAGVDHDGRGRESTQDRAHRSIWEP